MSKKSKKGEKTLLQIEEKPDQPDGFSFDPVPQTFVANFAKFSLPCIQKKGFEYAIEYLANVFEYKNFRVNLLEFWLLDVLVNFLARLQIHYKFTDEYQYNLFNWVLYVLDYLQANASTLSHQTFLNYFNGIILYMMKSNLQNDFLVSASNYIADTTTEDLDTRAEATPTTRYPAKCTGVEISEAVLNLKDSHGSFHQFSLPDSFCIWNDELLLTTRQQLADDAASYDQNKTSAQLLRELITLTRTLYLTGDVPERFLSPVRVETQNERFGDTGYVFIAPAEVVSAKLASDTKLREIWDASNTLVESKRFDIMAIEKRIFINRMAILAFREFIYEYCFDAFQFELVRMALFYSDNAPITPCNDVWCMPKFLGQEVKKPLVKKFNKFMKKEEARRKKILKQLQKKRKPPKLSKKEKSELAKAKKLQQKLEAEMRKQEAMKRLIVPLQTGTTAAAVKELFVVFNKLAAERSQFIS